MNTRSLSVAMKLCITILSFIFLYCGHSQATAQSESEGHLTAESVGSAEHARRLDSLIAATADACGNDPKRLFEYVRNNFESEPFLGQRKSPHLTLLDHSGSVCDLASLLVALLRAAGYEARYAVGYIVIPYETTAAVYWTQILANWLGASPNLQAVLAALGRSGMPATEVPSSAIDAELPAHTALQHVWVKAYIDGSWKSLFPSLKAFEYSEPADLEAMLGYDRNAIIDRALAGTTVAEDYVQGVNAQNLYHDLSELAISLQHKIESLDGCRSLSQLLGSRQVVEGEYKAGQYPLLETEEHDELPEELIYLLRVKLPGIAVDLPVKDIANKRLSVSFSSEGNRPVLSLDGNAIAVGRPAVLGDDVAMNIKLSFPGTTTEPRKKILTVGADYAVVVTAGVPSARALQASYEPPPGDSGGGDGVLRGAIGRVLHRVGSAYIQEEGMLSSFLAGPIAGGTFVPHVRVAVAAQEDGYHIDDYSTPFTAFLSPPNENRLTALLNVCSIVGSAAEYLHIEQMLGAQGVSTVSAFVEANARGQRIFWIDSSNVEEVLGLLDYRLGKEDEWREFISDGESAVIVPERPVQIGDWVGVAFAVRREGSVGHAISQLQGGLAVSGSGPARLDQVGREASFVPSGAVNGSATVATSLPFGELSVSARDLLLGPSPRHGLGAFSRTYREASRMNRRTMGYGWSNLFDIVVMEHSEWDRALGTRNAAEAAQLVTALFVATDLLAEAAHKSPLVRHLLATLAVDWGLRSLVRNAATISYGNGRTQTFLRMADGTFGPPPGLRALLTRATSGGWVLEYEGGDLFTFDETGRIEQWVDLDGNELAFHYVDGALSNVSDGAGRSLQCRYDGECLIGVADWAGRTVSYEYDGGGRLVGVEDDAGRLTAYTYDDANRLTSVTDPSDRVVLNNTYDELGRITSQSDGNGNLTRYVYGDNSAAVTDAVGETTLYAVMDNGQRIEVRDPLGGTTRYTYDSCGNLIESTDTAGTTTTYEYDGQDNLTRVVYADGSSAEYVYDERNQLVELHDENGNITSYAYDSRQHLSSIIDPLRNTTGYEYTPTGEVSAITAPTGSVTRLSYDVSGDLTAITDPLGSVWRMEYDLLGRARSILGPMDIGVTLEYDEAGNVVQATDSAGASTAITYDERDLPTAVTDLSGKTTTYEYDGNRNPVRVVLPGAYAIEFAYDHADRVSSIVAASGLSASIERDALGRVIAVEDPPGLVTHFTYDAVGRVVLREDPSGNLTSYEYDARGRVARISYAAGSGAYFEYDPAGNLTRASYQDWLAEYSYDGLNRLTSISYPNVNQVVTKQYDAGGSQTRVTLSVDGAVKHRVDYRYDAGGRLVEIVDETGTTDFTFDAASRLERIHYANGAGSLFSYGSLGLLSELLNVDSSGQVLLEANYSYDLAGQLVRANHSEGAGSLVETFAYDSIGRLVRVDTATHSTTYSYDEAGNRLSKVEGTNTTDYTYNRALQLVKAGDTRFEHDANGNVIRLVDAEGTYTFEYDCEDRLVGIRTPGREEINYAYDAFGRLAAREDGSGTTHFTYTGGVLLAAGAADLNRGTLYTYGNGYYLSSQDMSDDSRTRFYHYDRRGNVSIVTDPEGLQTAAHDCDAFGAPLQEEEPGADWLTFLGRWGVVQEPSVPGLYMTRSRPYFAPIGRFLTTDKLQITGRGVFDLNPYVYARNDPINYVDPFGYRALYGGACADEGGCEITASELANLILEGKVDVVYVTVEEGEEGVKLVPIPKDWCDECGTGGGSNGQEDQVTKALRLIVKVAVTGTLPAAVEVVLAAYDAYEQAKRGSSEPSANSQLHVPDGSSRFHSQELTGHHMGPLRVPY